MNSGQLRVHIAVFDPRSATRHGGIRRSAQLSKVADANLTLVVPARKAAGLLQTVQWIGTGLFQLRGAAFPLITRLKAAFAVGYVLNELARFGGDVRTATFVIELCRGATLFVAYWLALRGGNFAVAPQNVEFLVSARGEQAKADELLFRMERTIYRCARRVACISEVDAYIVRCLDGRALTLPYFPDETEVARFVRIRRAREGRGQSSRLLYLGTVTNPPTLAGLRQLLDRFCRVFDERWSLGVAGYGTQRVVVAQSDRISIEGVVTNERLDELLIECDAVLLNQAATTGFLTRLVELNLCDVPVFMNQEYLPATSLDRYGIRTYGDLGEVPRMLDEQPRSTFDLFEPPGHEITSALWTVADGDQR